MKLAAWLLITASVVFGIWAGAAEVLADYELQNSIGSYWGLSVKASTLDAKAKYLDQFVAAVDKANLSGNNAIFLKTPDNSFEQNVTVLRTLQTRMNEVKGMDVTSFAYQQAISQITQQEQDEATRLLSVIAGVWYLKHHPFLWDWIDVVKWFMIVGLLIAGFICMLLEYS